MAKVAAHDNLKKPASSYWLWLNANREKITKLVGSGKGSEVGKKGGEMWKTISDEEKRPFEEQAKQQKEAYEQYLKTPEGEAGLKALKEERKAGKLQRVRKNMRKAAKAVERDNNLKKPVSSYWLWLSANRENIAKLIGTGKGSEVSRKGGEMWKTVSAAEKKPFEDEAQRQKDTYQEYLKTPDGEAGLKAFKEAQAAAKSQVKGASMLENDNSRKRKVNDDNDEDNAKDEANTQDAPSKRAKKATSPKKEVTVPEPAVRDEAKQLGYTLKLTTLMSNMEAKGVAASAEQCLAALKGANGSAVVAKKTLAAAGA